MHGSFSPIDVHNTLIAAGPDFRTRYLHRLPSGNVDVAPTVAHILGLQLAGRGHDGRVLVEALPGGKQVKSRVTRRVVKSSVANDLTVVYPTDPDGHDVNAALHRYHVELHTQTLHQSGKTYTYFDQAQAVRQ